jgi:hypothetical protein
MPGIALDRKPTTRTDQLICTAPKRRMVLVVVAVPISRAGVDSPSRPMTTSAASLPRAGGPLFRQASRGHHPLTPIDTPTAPWDPNEATTGSHRRAGRRRTRTSDSRGNPPWRSCSRRTASDQLPRGAEALPRSRVRTRHAATRHSRPLHPAVPTLLCRRA